MDMEEQPILDTAAGKLVATRWNPNTFHRPVHQLQGVENFGNRGSGSRVLTPVHSCTKLIQIKRESSKMWVNNSFTSVSRDIEYFTSKLWKYYWFPVCDAEKPWWLDGELGCILHYADYHHVILGKSFNLPEACSSLLKWTLKPYTAKCAGY